MAKQDMEIGAAGRQVIENMFRLRKTAGLTLVQLSERTEKAGRGLSVSALSLIATGKRRVDVDDLSTLASALGVSTAELLGGSDTYGSENGCAVVSVGSRQRVAR